MQTLFSYLAIAVLWVGVLGMSGCAIDDFAEEGASESRAAESNVQLGIGYIQHGNYAVALEKLKKALEQDPDLPSAHHYVAVLYEAIGETELADKHFRRAVRLDPEDPRIRSNYGRYLCGTGQYDDAEKNFMLAAGNPLYDGKAMVYTNAGMCVRSAGASEKAERYFRRALQVQPNFAVALFEMMKLSFSQKKYLRARGYLQRYESVRQPGAESLLWGMRVESALKNDAAAKRYALRLRSEYPESSQALEVMGN